MRIPTFSRQSEPETPEAERPAPAGAATATDTRTTPVQPRRDERRDEPTTADLRTTPKSSDLPPAPPPAGRATPPPPPSTVSRPVFPKADDKADDLTERTPVVTGPKPRASLLATLGLILGVAGLALILSLSGIHATGKRHVAGKTDALIGMILALAAIVLGVLALTGSLTWLGTDTGNVPALRDWLDTHTVNRF